jgi:hypothetical protein
MLQRLDYSRFREPAETDDDAAFDGLSFSWEDEIELTVDGLSLGIHRVNFNVTYDASEGVEGWQWPDHYYVENRDYGRETRFDGRECRQPISLKDHIGNAIHAIIVRDWAKIERWAYEQARDAI